MTTADLHEIAPNLVVIEGHRPHAVWEDPDLATIAVYRGERTLYLLDTGVGPEQRAALLRVAERLGDGAEEVLLLNSHGHMDHFGNNDVLAEIPAATPAPDAERGPARARLRGVLRPDVPPRRALRRLPGRAVARPGRDRVDPPCRRGRPGPDRRGRRRPRQTHRGAGHHPGDRAVHPVVARRHARADLPDAVPQRGDHGGLRGSRPGRYRPDRRHRLERLVPQRRRGERAAVRRSLRGRGRLPRPRPPLPHDGRRDHLHPDLGRQRPAQRGGHGAARAGDDGRGRPGRAGRRTPPAAAGSRRRGAGRAARRRRGRCRA